MPDDQRSIFISYRREASAFIARAIFQDLRVHDYDVFMDVESIASGDFGRIILNQIAARAHFLIILARGSVERCADQEDWLRREIEHALDLKRNVIPIMVDDFSFKGTEPYLTGKLAALSGLNALPLNNQFFDASMQRLRDQFLKQPVYGQVVPAPAEDLRKVWDKLLLAAQQPKATAAQLTAEDLVTRASDHIRKSEFDAAFDEANEALLLNPNHAVAYSHRGLIRNYRGDFNGAIADLTEAIRLDPRLVVAHNNRGLARNNRGDYDGALADLTEALRLDPGYTNAYANRGVSFYHKGNVIAAIEDFRQAIRLSPDYAVAYSWLGSCYDTLGHFGEALDNYLIYLQIPNAPRNDYVWQRAQFLRQYLGR